jgi:glycerophosphoryl diester phosphodiesterase
VASSPTAPPTVIAHRGASAAHPPGNTIDAFAAAGPLGATWVELDVRRTADGALAVHHDAHLPEGPAISRLRADELPAWVPLLEVALDACAGLGVNIEIKNMPDDPDFDEARSVADRVVAVAETRDALQPLLVSSFDIATIERVRALAPALPTAFLVVDPAVSSIDAAAGGGHAAIHPWYPAVTAEVVARAHDLGLTVNVWTVDDPDDIRRMADLGVDGIVTDVPDVAVRVLAG